MAADVILKPSDFEALVGKELPLADADIALTLESVTPFTAHALRAEPFSLALRLPAGWRGDQGLYALAHPRLGRIELFCTPIAPAAGCARLEAVFN